MRGGARGGPVDARLRTWYCTGLLNTGKHTSLPAYARLANELRRAVAKREFAPGARVAAEHELARRRGLSRVTVRRATELLVAEGLLERRAGKGLYVREREAAAARVVRLLVHNLAWEPSVRVARGAQEVARRHGVEVRVVDAQGRQELYLEALSGLAQGGASGAILQALHTAAFHEEAARVKAQGLPLVVLDHHPRELGVPAVVADNYAGGALAGRHLAGLGHARVAFVGDCAASTVRARLDGFRDALAESGLALPREAVADLAPDDVLGDWGELVRRAVRRLLGGVRRPTAVFCSCDAVARACYRACEALKLGIPRDVSVVGFDDDPLAEWLSPPLTTVRQPFAEMGRAAMELLLEQLAGRACKSAAVTLPVEWAARGSTDAPAAVNGQQLIGKVP